MDDQGVHNQNDSANPNYQTPNNYFGNAQTGILRIQLNQADIPPRTVKSRHIEAAIIFSGTTANRPANVAAPLQNEKVAYFSTDQHSLSLWNVATSQWDVFQRNNAGIAASRPTSGKFAGESYFATDTFAFSVWTGAAWKSTTLT